MNSNRLPLRTQAQPGGFWRRAAAFLIDGSILGFIQMPIGFAQLFFMQPIYSRHLTEFAALGESDPSGLLTYLFTPTFIGAVVASTAASSIGGIAISALWVGWFYKNKGATPGKLAVDLRVIDSDTGAYLTYARAFLRDIAWKQLLPMFVMLVFFGITILLLVVPMIQTSDPTLAPLDKNHTIIEWFMNERFRNGVVRITALILIFKLCFLLCYLVAAFRKDKKAVHDLVFGTQVISAPKDGELAR